MDQQQLHSLIPLALYAIKILVIFGVVLGSVPFMVLWERALIARIQHRAGPNRVGLGGLPGLHFLHNKWLIGGVLQALVDGIKLFLKEDIRPKVVDPVLHTLAPLITVIPAIFLLAIIPFGPPIQLPIMGQVYTIPLGITDLDIGLLFYLAITGVAVYGIVLAGWSSNSKYSLLGGVRSSAQMLSYEIALGLSLIGVLLIASTFNLRELIAQQSGGIWTWNIVRQPVGFVIFLIAGFAETNRLPFDLPEGESELGAGFHTEYSSMKFAMFFMAEYMNMFTFSAILTTLFLGGFTGPIASPFAEFSIANAIWGLAWFSIKIFMLISFMIFIRGTWPRFRYDQLMNLGWKVLFPLALINVVITAGVIAFAGPRPAGGLPTTHLQSLVLFAFGAFQLIALDRILTYRRKRVLGYVR